jgi:undecaprenyl-diphosphatase
MSLVQALILGIVQGATEYIPVSSSAHLVLVPWLLGWPDATFEFEVLVQMGTLVGVFVFFWNDILAIVQAVTKGILQRKPLGSFEARLGWLVVVATIPAVFFGFLFKDYFEAAFSSPVLAGSLLILTSALLVLAERYGSRTRQLTGLRWLDAVVIGLWQVAAMLPGISRSGATISGAVLNGFNRTAAARFSFLMSIPVLLGAGVVTMADLFNSGTVGEQIPSIAVGFVAAAVSGYLCIRWLLGYLQRHSLYVFAIYCATISVLTILVALVRS